MEKLLPKFLFVLSVIAEAVTYALFQLDVDTIAKTLGVITSLLFLLGFFVAVIYYFWKQKSKDQLEKTNAELNETIKRVREDKAEVLAKLAVKVEELSKSRTNNGVLKEKLKQERILVLKQAAKLEGLTFPDSHFEHLGMDDDDE